MSVYSFNEKLTKIKTKTKVIDKLV